MLDDVPRSGCDALCAGQDPSLGPRKADQNIPMLYTEESLSTKQGGWLCDLYPTITDDDTDMSR